MGNIAAGLNATAETVIGIQHASLEEIQRIQSADFGHEARLQDRIDGALLAASCCMDEAAHARTLEQKHKELRHAAAASLGHEAFTKSSQFNMLFNYKLERKMNASLAIVAGHD